MREEKLAITIVAEPNLNIANDINKQSIWLHDLTRSASLLLNYKLIKGRCEKLYAGEGFVVARLSSVVLVSVYLSPALKIRQVEHIVRDMQRCINHYKTQKIIIAGDFNARAKIWGDVLTNARGRIIEDWLNSTKLTVINRGKTPTCVRPQGASIVDITITNDKAKAHISAWQVAENIVTLSDHRMLTFDIEIGRLKTIKTYGKIAQKYLPKWNYATFDADMFKAAFQVATWTMAAMEFTNVDEEAARMEVALKKSCDATMKRSTGRASEEPVHWWTAELTVLRRRHLSASRRLSRVKRRKQVPLQLAEALREERSTKKELKREIIKQKKKAWNELILTLDDDPWGLPYKIVANKLMKPGTEVASTMKTDDIQKIVSELFPVGESIAKSSEDGNVEFEPFNMEELETVTRDIASRRTPAPGPDGVNAMILVTAIRVMPGLFLKIMNRCISEKRFPVLWKKARLVLLRKPNKTGEDAKCFRPISFLNETSKLMERMLKTRIQKYMEDSNKDLSSNQFGFRRGLSCLEAIGAAKDTIKASKKKNYNTCVVGLDITNAFNSLPGGVVIRALIEKGIPIYLIEIIKDYLRDRELMWVSVEARCIRHRVSKGVPQGSVLGPLLWNISFDQILSSNIPEGGKIIGYADDTLLMATQRKVNATISTMQIIFEIVYSKLKDMGLTLAKEKTEVIWAASRNVSLDEAEIQLGDQTSVVVSKSMKYLGVHLDGHLKFNEHIKIRTEKTKKMMNGLKGILQNIKGPRENKRRLYVNAVQSCMLYGCPHWYESYLTDPKMLRPYQSINRQLALRVVSAYKTVSKVAVEILAKMPPIEMIVQALAEAYLEIRRHEGPLSKEIKKEKVKNKKEEAIGKWKNYLRDPRLPGKRVTSAILPVFDSWLNRKFGQLDYFTTQMITGHGAFRDYLYRFNLVESNVCLQCKINSDTAQHTIEVCPEWNQERLELQREVGRDLSLRAIIEEMLKRPEAWTAFQQFSQVVLKKKEEFVKNLITAGYIEK